VARPCDRVAPLILLKISAAKRRRYVCSAAKLTRRFILIHDLLDCKEILPNLLTSQIEKNDNMSTMAPFPEASHSSTQLFFSTFILDNLFIS